MTIEDTKIILNKIRESDLNIRRKRAKVEALKVRTEGRAIQYDKLNVMTSVTNMTEELLVDIVDLEKEIEEDIAQSDELAINIYRTINTLPSLDEQNVLLYY